MDTPECVAQLRHLIGHNAKSHIIGHNAKSHIIGHNVNK